MEEGGGGGGGVKRWDSFVGEGLRNWGVESGDIPRVRDRGLHGETALSWYGFWEDRIGQ